MRVIVLIFVLLTLPVAYSAIANDNFETLPVVKPVKAMFSPSSTILNLMGSKGLTKVVAKCKVNLALDGAVTDAICVSDELPEFASQTAFALKRWSKFLPLQDVSGAPASGWARLNSITLTTTTDNSQTK